MSFHSLQKSSQYCESVVQPEPTAEEQKAIMELFEQMPQEALEELHAAMSQCKSADEFVNRIFVGDCPKCGSSETGACENDPEIGELLVGRCYQCGQLWCTECLTLLKPGSPSCDCWDDEEDLE
jgi:hypothetical protein